MNYDNAGWNKTKLLHTSYGRDIPYKNRYIQYGHTILLCLHGFGGDKNSSVIEALDKELFTDVVALDWPAHGESRAEDDELTVENCLKDLDSMIMMLKTEHPDNPIVCFATSFGGYIATLYRNAHPGVFVKLILRSPALKMAETFEKLVQEEDFSRLQDGEKITLGFDRKMQIGKEFYDGLVENPVYDTPIEDPMQVMIMQGDQDDVVDPEEICCYAEANKIRLKLFEGTDHRYKKEGELKKIIEYTDDFLSIRYSVSDEGTLYRIGRGIVVYEWDILQGKWERDEGHFASQRYFDITGQGGNWDKYTDIDEKAAWMKAKRSGGTMEEFTKG